MTPKEKKMPGKRWIGRLVWLLIALGLLGAVAGVSAKYAQTKTDVTDTVAEDFYFTSPLLSTEGSTYTLMPTTTSLEIPICNYADSLRTSTANISYSYTVTKEDGTAVAGGSGDGTLTGGAQSTGKISLTGLTTGTYTVKASASSPFAANLAGTFVIPTADTGVHYTVSDTKGSAYATLTVWTEDYTGNIVISWSAGLIPDSTDPALSGLITGSGAGSLTVAGEAYASNTYRFFKTDTSAVYDTNNIMAVAK